MSVPSPWSVKGVQPKAREAAKDLARREGLTLGEWLNRLIGDVDEDGEALIPREPAAAYAPQNQATTQTSAPAHQQEHSFVQEAPRMSSKPLAPFPEPNAEQWASQGYGQSGQGWNPREAENSRLTAALEQLTRRLDMTAGPYAAPQSASPSPYTNTIPSALAERIEASERRAETALGRVDASLSDVRQTQAALAERLRAMESQDPNHKSLAALRGLETALARLSQQVFDTEARSEALETRIDEKLAKATAQITADTGLKDRVGEIEQITQQALETLDTSVSIISKRLASTEAVAGETSTRLAEAMIDLSARITGVEQSGDDPRTANSIQSLGERLAGIEDVTTQAIESVDKGLGLVSQRVAATEALAQATNERLVEALIDLSARLVQLENIDSQEAGRDLLSALEAKNKELTRRLEALDNKIETTRTELTHEVKSAIATGVDGRMAEIAKALADRLDVSERRNGEALERVGAEMARASISLDQRLRQIEERGTDDVAASMRNEMAKMARAIDERMASMERRDAAALDQAGGHLQQLAHSLGEKLDASEARAQHAVQTVSTQMEQLAQRLQARQDETAKNLVTRMEDGETRGHQELQNSLAQISAEIRSSEDRAKAATAPLHRDFNAMVDRLDQVEASGLAPYTENASFADQSVTIGQGNDFGQSIGYEPTQDRQRDAFGTPAPQPISHDDFSLSEPFSTVSREDAGRRPGFGVPFPGTEGGNLDSSLVRQSNGSLSNFDEDPFSMASKSPAIGPETSDRNAFDFDDDMDESWSEPGRAARSGGADYLTTARNAASRAAAERADTQKPAKKKAFLGAASKKSEKSATDARKSGTVKAEKSKPALSPVGIAAAAALVVTTGIIGYNFITRDKAQNDMPASLTPAQPAAIAPAAPVVTPEVTADASATDATLPAATPATATAPVPVFVPPPATDPKAKAPVPTPPAVPNAKAATRVDTKPTAEMRRFAETQAARAQEAQARSLAAEARLKTVAPATKAPGTPTRPVPVPQIATPQNKSASLTPKAAPSVVAAPRVAVAAAPRTSAAAAIAAASGNARQLYEQALARQQSGDAAGAVAMMRAAADTGDARSINRLAKMYERGEGVARDAAQARALTERAAARGSRQAMHNLGVYYAEGDGPQRDLSKAAESFRRAANKGVADSQFNLGAMAEQGLGGQRSDREAYYWYSVAARSGDRDAASKTRELGARLPPTDRAAEDQRVASFRPEPGGED